MTRAPTRSPRRTGERRRHHRHRRRIGPLAVMPTLVTLGNLLAGFTAIHFATKPIDSTGLFGWSSLSVAGALVFLGLFLDAIDGSIARLTRSFSDIGAQLDSLADLVTFGVAPAIMMLRLVSYYLGPADTPQILGPDADHALAKLLWGVAGVYVSCTALRLARFNVETPSAAVDEHLLFRGLPSPGAAGTVASLIVLHEHWLSARGGSPDEVSVAFARWTSFGIPLVTLLCAIAMVSSLPYVHTMNRYVRGRRSFAYVARIVIPIVLAVWWFQEMLAIAFTWYACSSPMHLLWSRMRRALRQRSSARQSNA